MQSINRLVAAALLAFGAVSGPILAQTPEQPAAQKDESKMDPKGIPGSPSTQGGKAPEGSTDSASGSSSGSSTGSSAGSSSGSSSGTSSGTSGASEPGRTHAAKTPEEVTQSRDESKMDAKGIPGSTSTQGGPEPSKSK